MPKKRGSLHSNYRNMKPGNMNRLPKGHSSYNLPEPTQAYSGANLGMQPPMGPTGNLGPLGPSGDIPPETYD